MSASVAIAAGASANAAAASAMARKAHKASCEALMPAYTHQTATTEQARAYAECVSLMSPTEWPAGMELVVKVVIVLMLLAVPIGAKRGWDEFPDVMNALLSGIWAACMVLMCAIALFVAWVGVLFVVS